MSSLAEGGSSIGRSSMLGLGVESREAVVREFGVDCHKTQRTEVDGVKGSQWSSKVQMS